MNQAEKLIDRMIKMISQACGRPQLLGARSDDPIKQWFEEAMRCMKHLPAISLEEEMRVMRERNAAELKLKNDHLDATESELNTTVAERDYYKALAESRETAAKRYAYLRDCKNDFPHPFIALRAPINVVSQVRGNTADFAVDQAMGYAVRPITIQPVDKVCTTCHRKHTGTGTECRACQNTQEPL